MDLRQYLVGTSQKDFGARVGVSQAMVSHWLTGRKRITAEFAMRIAEATDWRLRPHDLRPDLYPNATDGLPAKEAA